MPEFLSELLTAFVPESDFWKVVAIAIIVLGWLAKSGKLNWIGRGAKYLWFRCLRCPFKKHDWVDTTTSLEREYGIRTWECRYCRLTDSADGFPRE